MCSSDLASEMRVDYAQRLQPMPQWWAVAARDHHRRDACLLQQLEAVAIQRVEALERFAMLGQVQATICQHTIDIEKSNANALCF